MVYLLKKSLFGLKQSSQAWFQKFARVVYSFSFSICKIDHSIFTKRRLKGIVILLVYIDNIIVIGSDSQDIIAIKQHFSRAFQIKDFGSLCYFSGIEVARTKINIFVS